MMGTIRTEFIGWILGMAGTAGALMFWPAGGFPYFFGPENPYTPALAAVFFSFTGLSGTFYHGKMSTYIFLTVTSALGLFLALGIWSYFSSVVFLLGAILMVSKQVRGLSPDVIGYILPSFVEEYHTRENTETAIVTSWEQKNDGPDTVHITYSKGTEGPKAEMNVKMTITVFKIAREATAFSLALSRGYTIDRIVPVLPDNDIYSQVMGRRPDTVRLSVNNRISAETQIDYDTVLQLDELVIYGRCTILLDNSCDS
jgi:hypothetical protein